MEKRHIKIRISGKVQGVWFRASTRDKAHELGLSGFVRNEPDGSVYAEAEGPPDVLDRFLAWCRIGPPRASVSQVEVEEGAWLGFQGFEVRR